MNTHQLKCAPEAFDAVEDGLKTFEYRWDDRGFQESDELLLRRWTPDKGYDGRQVLAVVPFILRGGQFGVPRGYVVMSLAQVVTVR